MEKTILADFHCHPKRDYPAEELAEMLSEGVTGLAILNHPYVVSTGRKIIKYRLANEAEEKKLEELCKMVDEVEVFNAQNINLLPFVAWMKKANKKARLLAEQHGFRGTASSDAHRLLSQVRAAGIYLPFENICIDAIKEHIIKGNFERLENYVSRYSFLKGMFFS